MTTLMAVDPELLKTFRSDELLKWLERHRMTQTQAALAIGVSKSYFNQVAKGERLPSPKVADWLDSQGYFAETRQADRPATSAIPPSAADQNTLDPITALVGPLSAEEALVIQQARSHPGGVRRLLDLLVRNGRQT